MDISILKKIFTKPISEECLKHFNPEKFGLKSPRCRKITYIGENIWEDLLNININLLKQWIREYSMSEKGKYNYVKDEANIRNLIKDTSICKGDSPCHPQQFSESVVKPNIRQKLKGPLLTSGCDELVNKCMSDITPLLENHIKERINQQLKADFSEYIILKGCENIIPTLKHSAGIDMYILNDKNELEELDIKTTRTLWKYEEDPKEAIKKLYEKQGEDRFSSEPRLYIYLSDKNIEINSGHIIEQLNKKYTISFKYKKKEYIVEGARLIKV